MEFVCNCSRDLCHCYVSIQEGKSIDHSSRYVQATAQLLRYLCDDMQTMCPYGFFSGLHRLLSPSYEYCSSVQSILLLFKVLHTITAGVKS